MRTIFSSAITAIVLVTVSLTAAWSGDASEAGNANESGSTDQLISFRIKDQFDYLHTDGRYRNSVLLITWADRKGSEYLGDWNRALADSLGEEVRTYRLRMLSVAHVKGVPFFIKGKIKNSFKQDTDKPVLLDWGGEFAEAYTCQPDHCNLLIFDRSGLFVASYAVTAVDSSFRAEVVAEVRALTR